MGNIDTGVRLAMIGVTRSKMAGLPEACDPRAFFKALTVAARAHCKARLDAFGGARQVSAIKVVPLLKLAVRYVKGELKAVVQ